MKDKNQSYMKKIRDLQKKIRCSHPVRRKEFEDRVRALKQKINQYRDAQ